MNGKTEERWKNHRKGEEAQETQRAIRDWNVMQSNYREKQCVWESWGERWLESERECESVRDREFENTVLSDLF